MASRAADPGLIGQPGSRARIPTPAAVLDLDIFEANLAKMAGRAKAAGLALRPHTKSHKCAAIARMQLEAGAVGVCCAKLAEAEAMAAAGIGAILVTSPIAGEASARRAAALAGLPDFRLVVDHVDAVGELAATSSALQLIIDVDVGLGRTGVHDADQAADVARAILRHPQLSLLGVQGYGGHWQHMAGANARASAVAEGMGRLTSAIAAIREAGGPVEVVTGGGTGTFAADAAQGVLTEVQPGSYPFMDREYREALGGDPDGDFGQALFVAASVISANHPKWVTGGRRAEGLLHRRAGAGPGGPCQRQLPVLRRRAWDAHPAGGPTSGAGRPRGLHSGPHRPDPGPLRRHPRGARRGAGGHPAGRGARRQPVGAGQRPSSPTPGSASAAASQARMPASSDGEPFQVSFGDGA
jgi:D-serine deaminase-like pyridoxal phosphate-dependent protein